MGLWYAHDAVVFSVTCAPEDDPPSSPSVSEELRRAQTFGCAGAPADAVNVVIDAAPATEMINIVAMAPARTRPISASRTPPAELQCVAHD
jgi:hypothetical protein